MMIATIVVSVIFFIHMLILLFGILSKDSNINQNVNFQGGKMVGSDVDNGIIPILQTGIENMDTVVKGMHVPVAPVTSSFSGLQIRISYINTNQFFDVYLENQLVIGREGGDAFIQLSDSNVSSKHCMLYRKGNQIMLQDLGSTNHTYLNSCMLECPMPVSSGDIIRLGNSMLQIQNVYANA